LRKFTINLQIRLRLQTEKKISNNKLIQFLYFDGYTKLNMETLEYFFFRSKAIRFIYAILYLSFDI